MNIKIYEPQNRKSEKNQMKIKKIKIEVHNRIGVNDFRQRATKDSNVEDLR
jgi:hypothetical protein